MLVHTKIVETYWVNIYLAGDIEIAKQICRKYCFEEGLCITISPCEYIYTGGQETGYVVGLVNYPRFPTSSENIFEKSEEICRRLMYESYQESALIVSPNITKWLTRRKSDLEEVINNGGKEKETCSEEKAEE